MNASINAWAVGEDTGFSAMFRQIRLAGFAGIELNIDADGASAHSLSMATTPAGLAEIRSMAEAEGLSIVSISTSLYGESMGSPSPAEREKAKALLQKQLECAQALGAGGILIVPAGHREWDSLKHAREACLGTLASLRDMILQSGVNVGVENVWNGFFLSPYDMAGFIDQLACPAIGAYYDVGNVVAFSTSHHWIEVLGNRIKNVHIKDFKRAGSSFGGLNSGGRFVDLGKGDVEWPKVITALEAAGYDGYLTAEVFQGDSDCPDPGLERFYRRTAEAVAAIIAGKPVSLQ